MQGFILLYDGLFLRGALLFRPRPPHQQNRLERLGQSTSVTRAIVVE